MANNMAAELMQHLTARHLHPKHEWLQSFLATTRPNTPLAALKQTCLFRLLATDITTSLDKPAALVLPADVLRGTVQACTLAGPIICQVLDVEDIGQSRWSQVEAIEARERGETTKGREIIRVVEPENDGSDQAAASLQSKGPFKLLLQDAKGLQIYALDLRGIDGLSTSMSMGVKLLLRNVEVRRAVVMLDSGTVQILGGKLEALDRAWKEGRKDRLIEAANAGASCPSTSAAIPSTYLTSVSVFKSFQPAFLYAQRTGILPLLHGTRSPSGISYRAQPDMLCDTCLGVLQDCRNLIKTDQIWCLLSHYDTYNDIKEAAQDHAEAGTQECYSDDITAEGSDNGFEGDTGSLEAEEGAVAWIDTVVTRKTSHHIAGTSGSGRVHNQAAGTEGRLSRMNSTTSINAPRNAGEGVEGKKHEQKGTTDAVLSIETDSTSAKYIGMIDDADTEKRHAMYGHHLEHSTLQAAAEGGCQVCWQVVSLLSNGGHQVATMASTVQSVATPGNVQYCTLAIVNASFSFALLDICFQGTHGFYSVCKFRLYTEKSDWSTIPQGPVESSSTASPESLQIAQQWLHECVNTHASCTIQTEKEQWYPTRLLDLGDLADDGLHHLRVISTQTHTMDGHYATLSHRWGSCEFLQLKRCNLDNFYWEIPVPELPRTFREAMMVCRALQIRYLWIDSLCIVQDDASDWAFEASQMHMVYSNTYCNLSASHAENGTRGLFQDRDARALCTTEVELCLRNENLDNLDNSRRKHLLTNEEGLYDEMLNCPLNKRGWVFQERILAPRVLHFCRDQLFWECRNKTACEQYRTGLGRSAYKYLPVSVKRDIAFNRKDEVFWTETWQGLVEIYSGTNLTFPSDKLVALSGIAKTVGSFLHDEYVAGMWRKILGRQILWEVAGGGTRPVKYRSPSWSWASVDGDILFAGRYFVLIDFEVVDVHIDYVTEDHTGEVRGGWLDLRGYLRPIQMKQIMDDPIAGRIWVIPKKYDSDLPEVWPVTAWAKADLDDATLNDEIFLQESTAGQHFCFVACLPGLKSDGRPWRMLLLRLVNPKLGQYERIGVATTHDQTGERPLLLEENAAKSLPCLQYDEGAGKHTIRMI